MEPTLFLEYTYNSKKREKNIKKIVNKENQ